MTGEWFSWQIAQNWNKQFPEQPVAIWKPCGLATLNCDVCGSQETVIEDETVCKDCGQFNVTLPDGCSECGHPYRSVSSYCWQGCGQCSNGIVHDQGHVVEDTLGIAITSDIETPTDYYYEQLEKDMKARHSKASDSILEHCISLEAFLDVSVLFGFSFGAEKALIAVIVAELLGHVVGRMGATCQDGRTDAVMMFAPLKEVSHVRQFVGSTNWLRFYMPAVYASVAKQLGAWMKEDAVFPPKGLGGGDNLSLIHI